MSITTTENIESSGLRCGRCNRSVLVALVDANNVPFGLCCATGTAREELLRLHGGYEGTGEALVGAPVEHLRIPLDALDRMEPNPDLLPAVKDLRTNTAYGHVDEYIGGDPLAESDVARDHGLSTMGAPAFAPTAQLRGMAHKRH